MRIVMLYPSPEPKGGPYTHLINLKRQLERMGHEVWLPRFPAIKRLGRLHPYAFNLLITKNFSQIPHGYDIIHCMSGGGVSLALYRNSFKMKTPLVTTYHGSWRIYDYAIRKYAPHTGVKFLLISRFIHPTEELSKYIELRASDRILAVSNHVRRMLMEDYGLHAEKIKVCYNGVDTKYFAPNSKSGKEIREKLGIEGSMVLYVGDVLPRKGVGYLIRAIPKVLRENPKTKFVFVGKGNWKIKYERLAHELGVSNSTTFVGYVPDMLLPAYYSACDVFAFPTLAEAFALVLLEAMACGKPIVATNVDGVPEAVKHRSTGILVRPGDANELASAIVELLEDPELAKKYGAEGRRTIEKRFTWKAVANRVLRIYKEALNKASAVD